MLPRKIEEIISFLEDKKIGITTHNSVDIDALVSCHVLKLFLKQYLNKEDVYLSYPVLTRSTRNFKDKFSEKFSYIDLNDEKKYDFSKVDIILILDTNNLNLVSFSEDFNILKGPIPFIFVDHHLDLKMGYKNNIESLNLILDDFTSTTEIIFELYETFNQSIPYPINYLFMTGILTDTGFFKYGNNDTIKHFSKLIDDQLDYKELLILLSSDEDISERIAKIKGLQRVKIIREGNWLMGISNIGSFGASVASSLLKNGFDVAVVLSKKKRESRISARASKKICLQTGLHLGKIFEVVSSDCNGNGGGHDGAASINYETRQEDVLNEVLSKIMQFMNNPSKIKSMGKI